MGLDMARIAHDHMILVDIDMTLSALAHAHVDWHGNVLRERYCTRGRTPRLNGGARSTEWRRRIDSYR